MQFSGHSGFTFDTSYSSDGKLVATANDDNTINIWDAHTGKQKTTLTGLKDSISQIAFSPDSTRIASSTWTGAIETIIWDLASGRVLFKLPSPSNAATTVAYSPDGKQVVSGYYDGDSIIWDAITGKELHNISLLTGAGGESVNDATYSPDSKLVAISGKLGTIKIWNALTGAEVLTLKGHTGSIGQITFSQDGKLLASASNDGTVRLWDVARGANFLTLPMDHAGGVSFSPDGKQLAVGSYLGIYIFTLPIEDVIALAKSRVTRSLTTEECQQYLHVNTCP